MRRPQMQRARAAHLPAPVGGINAVDPLSAMPPSDAILLDNLVPAEGGLRPRTGYRRWSSGLGPFRSIVPFAGRSADEARLLFCSPSKVYRADATNPSGAGYCLEFPVADTDESGFGVATNIVTAAGHRLLYADEANGYWTYEREIQAGTGTELRGWRRGVNAGVDPWAPLTAYALGDVVTNDGGKTYVCVQAGTSAAAGGPSGTSTEIGEIGGLTWSYSTPIAGFDPTEAASVCVWKNRVWLTRKDSSESYYSDLGAIYGTFTKFDWGSRFPHGGHLVGLWSWTIDGGVGIDDHLVAISSAGDVVVYKGTDPSSAETFAQVGSWYLSAVPAGRHIALAYGGDLLVLSKLGVIPLSRLIQGGEVSDPTIYATAKIRPLFAKLVAERGTLPGWHMTIHPVDGVLLVAVPNVGDDYTEQYAFSLARKSWSRFTGMPMLCSTVWNAETYFGGTGNYLWHATGNKDAVEFDGTLGSAIPWRGLSAYQAASGPTWKRVQQMKPRVTGTALVTAAPRYGFDTSSPALTPATPRWTGAAGMGSEMAIAFNGSSSAPCTLIGFDVQWDEGGIA